MKGTLYSLITVSLLCISCSENSHTESVSYFGNPAHYTYNGVTYQVKKNIKNFTQTGTASWYGQPFHGKLTANREEYNMYELSAAHRELPIPSIVDVTNLENGKSVRVRINDRGPFHSNRIIDLSYAAAKKIDMIKNGTAPVRIQLITPPQNHNQTILQFGAFKSLKRAIAFQELLKQKKITTQISNPHDKSPFFRVQSFPLINKKEIKIITQIALENNIDYTSH